MEPLGPDIDPFANDPARWGASLVNDAEILIGCLDAAGAKSVVEVGSYAGDLTRVLLAWAQRAGARVWAIDPSPQRALVALGESRDDLELVRATSREALKTIPLPEAAIIDGDHNYFTVSEELRIVSERAQGATLPLLLFHDVCWPHARRDDYYSPELIPEEHRHPTVQGGHLFPGEPGVRSGGLLFRWPAAREGGPRNGVLTAVEDFVGARDGLRLAIVPAFFGLGVVWDQAAPWAGAVAQVLRPWDRNPLLERLEANRVLHLAAANHAVQRAARQEAVLRRLLDSKAFAVAELLSRLRRRARVAADVAVVSKDDIRRALGDDEP
jgi:SAM-dependent methyltransferase